MDKIKNMLESLADNAGQAKQGDIGTLADLLHRLEEIKGAAEKGALHNISAAAEAVGEVVKKIIMEAVSDSEAAFQIVKDSVNILTQYGGEGDLQSLDAFPKELNLSDYTEASAAGEGPGSPLEMIDESIIAEFLDQHSVSIREMESKILLLEKGRDDEALAQVKRAIHTMKGEAGFLSLPNIEMVCHATENYIEAGSYPYNIELLLDVNDWLAAAISDLAAGRAITRKADEIIPRLRAAVEMKEGEAAEKASNARAPRADADSAPEEAVASTGSEPAAGRQPAAESLPATSNVLSTPSKEETNPLAEILPEEGFWRLTGDASLLNDFISESAEHLDNANAELLNLESDPANHEALNSVFRAFHTIKGIASFLELKEILKLAHDSENLLDLVRKGTLKISHELIDMAFEAMDMLGELIQKVKSALEKDGIMLPEPSLPQLIKSIQAAARGEFVRKEPVAPSESKLGELLVESGSVNEGEIRDLLKDEAKHPSGKKIGELLLKSNKVAPKDIAEALRRQQTGKEITKTGVELKETIRVDYARLENLVDTVGELVIAESMITQDDDIVKIKTEMVEKKLHNLKMISRKLQELGTNIRMVPIAGTFQKMARLVRDLSKKSRKNIEFITVGDETELDRAYVDKIGDPLVHMIRNAVDHGIEPPRDRVKAGKKEQAKVTLMAYHEGGNIIVELRDDGRGINKEAVRKKALEKNLISEEERLSEQELLHLIFHPGFSTASQVTEVSGRGVGMDVVKRNIGDLRGQIIIISEEGIGTTFKLVLPLTLALIDGMVVCVGKERFIFPVLSVVESVNAQADMVHTMMGAGEMISLRNKQLPFYRLGNVFEVREAKSNIQDGVIVIIENDGKKIGLLVDELLGLQQTVIKNLGSGIGNTPGVSGGAIMADGKVGLIVDVPGLFHTVSKMTLEGKSSEEEESGMAS